LIERGTSGGGGSSFTDIRGFLVNSDDAWEGHLHTHLDKLPNMFSALGGKASALTSQLQAAQKTIPASVILKR